MSPQEWQLIFIRLGDVCGVLQALRCAGHSNMSQAICGTTKVEVLAYFSTMISMHIHSNPKCFILLPASGFESYDEHHHKLYNLR